MRSFGSFIETAIEYLKLNTSIYLAVRFSGRAVYSRSRVRLALASHWSTHSLFLGHGRAVFLFHDSSFRSWFSVFRQLTSVKPRVCLHFIHFRQGQFY
ncbi:hypothetical protein T09_2402 [Trichinella sp. T9]|nr:hypothetical protein T09_2402 [Trichinella sp. T9]